MIEIPELVQLVKRNRRSFYQPVHTSVYRLYIALLERQAEEYSSQQKCNMLFGFLAISIYSEVSHTFGIPYRFWEQFIY